MSNAVERIAGAEISDADELARLRARVAELEEARRGLDPTVHAPAPGRLVLVKAEGRVTPGRRVRMPGGAALWRFAGEERDAVPADGRTRWLPMPRMEEP